jgi:segregation and condensation protein A
MSGTLAELPGLAAAVETDAAPPSVLDCAGWEDPPRAAAATSPVLSVEGFEGPLDWLLELARAKKINLAQLSILALIEAFADALEAALERPPDGTAAPPAARPDLALCGEWMVAAAQLTELRSRLLLPFGAPDSQAAAAEAEALRQGWLLRAQVAAGADWLERRPQLGVEVFGRGKGRESDAGPLHESAGPEAQDGRETDALPAEASDAEDEEPVAGGDLTDLLRACLAMLRLPAGAEAWRPEPPKLWGLADAARRIRHLLDLRPAGAAFEAFLPSVPADAHGRALLCRGAVAATFLAGLELARSEAVMMEQEESWALIRLSAIDPA